MKKKIPPSSDFDYERRFDEAIRHRNEGRRDESDRMLSELIEKDPENLAAALVRAGLLFDMGRFDEASKLFGKIVESSPSSELASRGFFHSLWKLGFHDAAFDEMRRFLQISDSDDYRQLLADMLNALSK